MHVPEAAKNQPELWLTLALEENEAFNHTMVMKKQPNDFL